MTSKCPMVAQSGSQGTPLGAQAGSKAAQMAFKLALGLTETTLAREVGRARLERAVQCREMQSRAMQGNAAYLRNN